MVDYFGEHAKKRNQATASRDDAKATEAIKWNKGYVSAAKRAREESELLDDGSVIGKVLNLLDR